jgi:hypothetical protein
MLVYLGSVAGILLGLVTLFSVLLAPASQPMPIHHAAAPSMRPAAGLRKQWLSEQSLSASHAVGDGAPQVLSARYARRRRVAHVNSPRWKSDQVASRDRVNEWAYGRERRGLPRGNSYAQGPSADVRGFW